MNIGDRAPEVLGKDEQGRDIRLSDYKGRKLVLYFYPKDNTSGCTAERIACEVQGETPTSLSADCRCGQDALGGDGCVGREEYVRQEDDGHDSHHLHHQRGGHHRADFRWQAGEDQRACRTDSECLIIVQMLMIAQIPTI